MNKLLGPILIIAGVFLLDLLSLNFPWGGVNGWVQRRTEAWGLGGALLLGAIFALSFCPVSAALFFGSLLPLAVKLDSSVLLPSVYGLGTGLPVLVFALLMSAGTRSIGQILGKVQIIEPWARRITGILFIVLGIYYVLSYVFGFLWSFEDPAQATGAEEE